MFLVVLAWAVLTTSGGAALGLVLLAWGAPRGAFLILGGVLVDRGDRRLIGAAASSGLAFLAGLLALAWAADEKALVSWITVALALGFLDGVRLPIGYALIPLVVDESDVLEANRWSQLRLWTALTIGPPLGGVSVAVLGVPGGFAAIATLYALGGAFLLTLPTMPVLREQRPGVLLDLLDAFRFVRRHERLRLLLPIFAAVNLFVLGLYAVGIPIFVKEGLGGDANDLGLVVGAFGAGLMFGTLALGRFPTWIKGSTAGLFTLFALSDLGLALVGLMPTVASAGAAFFASGFCIGPASTLYQAVLQTTTPAAYLGRVVGMSRAISFGFEPLSAAIVGQLSKLVSSGALVLAGGLAAMSIDVFATLRASALDRKPPGRRRKPFSRQHRLVRR